MKGAQTWCCWAAENLTSQAPRRHRPVWFFRPARLSVSRFDDNRVEEVAPRSRGSPFARSRAEFYGGNTDESARRRREHRPSTPVAARFYQLGYCGRSPGRVDSVHGPALGHNPRNSKYLTRARRRSAAGACVDFLGVAGCSSSETGTWYRGFRPCRRCC